MTDIELRVIAGALLPADKGGKQIPLGDGVDQNDKPFRRRSRTWRCPTDGLRRATKRTEPAHAPVPQPPRLIPRRAGGPRRIAAPRRAASGPTRPS